VLPLTQFGCLLHPQYSCKGTLMMITEVTETCCMLRINSMW